MVTGMAVQGIVTHDQTKCTVKVSPSEVEAGADLSLEGRVSCPHGCDLTGLNVSIRSQDDAELVMGELTKLDGEAYVTNELVLRAPLTLGQHIYRTALVPGEKDGVRHAGNSTEFRFVVKAHAAHVNVWGLPSAIVTGERFRLKVGIKCSAGCKLAGREVSIFDQEGGQAGAGNLLADPWPGTSALYVVDLEAEAPRVVGDYKWKVETPESDSGVAHAAGSATFPVKVVGPPDCEVTVKAFDSKKRTPIRGVHVLLHPYRALTDDDGFAKVKAAKGTYKLHVSGFKYIAYHNTIDAAGDVTIRLDLTSEPEGDDYFRS
jgi:hypothetical protein